MNDPIPNDLAAAVEGLLYPSETDAPLIPFRWKRGKRSAVESAIANSKERSPVETIPFDTFFEPLLRSTDAERFATLKRLLQDRLQDLAVVRVGSPRVTIYVIGRQGHYWAGVWTESVET
ncbi:nuclease A inhibitor family protein [Humisphaera borealis]|uniref:Nuclease n=1 Tax=Humisphaera borealis TaxID=2807512 RepID=A0A7M2WUV8_9BACT|nr:nuclease A inhibitor family protein [Humisphaera borealis]QOV89193.1 hypothetical protein IPV69_23755 [Humisphaera borealis]